MADTTRMPVTTAAKPATIPEVWRPFESLRREVDRLLDDFGMESWRSPFRHKWAVSRAPATDLVETEKAYEMTIDLPGFDEKDIEIKLANDSLSIKGARKSEKEEKKEGYYLSEREFGSIERSFSLPEGVDSDKIEATLKKGVLTITMPKQPEAQHPSKKIEVKPAT